MHTSHEKIDSSVVSGRTISNKDAGFDTGGVTHTTCLAAKGRQFREEREKSIVSNSFEKSIKKKIVY